MFREYPLAKDQWEDAEMESVYDYIKNYKGLQIPDEWRMAMLVFDQQYFLCRVACQYMWLGNELTRLIRLSGA